jgi:hypothetical protein
MAVLDKKVQLEILDKVANLGEDGFLSLDSLTLDQQFNFKYLAEKHCLNQEYEQCATDRFRQIIVGATSLTKIGQEFRLKLIEELESKEMRKISVEALQGANRRSTWAMLIAIVCAVISARHLFEPLVCWLSSFIR